LAASAEPLEDPELPLPLLFEDSAVFFDDE